MQKEPGEEAVLLLPEGGVEGLLGRDAGSRTPAVECTNLVDKGEAPDNGSDRECRLGVSLREMQLGGGGGGGRGERRMRAKWLGGERGLRRKRASCIEWESLVRKWPWEVRT